MSYTAGTRELEDRINELEGLVKGLQDALDRDTDLWELSEREHAVERDRINRQNYDRWDTLDARVHELESRIRRLE